MSETDRFGLKHLSTDQEMMASFVLFFSGSLLILGISWQARTVSNLHMLSGVLGLVMVGTAYTFAVESVRELNFDPHFLARLLETEG